MSMAHSIETRVPYLDHLLVSYVVGLPARLKLHGGRNKPLLIGTVRETLPREVWNRAKMGFTFPFAKWLKESAAELQSSVLERKVLEPAAVRQIWAAFQENRMHWSRPWSTVVASHFGSAK